MSWGPITATDAEVAGIEQALTDAGATYRAQLADNDFVLNSDAESAVTAAIAAAKSVVDSGVVGSGKVTISISGHANPNHAPVAGYANDFVTITVQSADPAPMP